MGKKGKKKEQEEVDEDQLLEQAIKEVQLQQDNAPSALDSDSSSFDLLKPNLRQLDPDVEVKELLGQHLVKSRGKTLGGPSKIGKVIKAKPHWPQLRNLGFTFESIREKGSVKWYNLEHSAHYDALNGLFDQYRLIHDYDSIMHIILADNPYHLGALFLNAHNYNVREEHENVRDTIERALYAITSISNQFNLFSHEHRLLYKHAKNRIVFQILWIRVQELMKRHCYGTALQYAKVLLAKDPETDPFATSLLIDFLAIRSGNLEYLTKFYERFKDEKRLDMLPNYLYSTAYAYDRLYEKTGEASYLAKSDELITLAYIRFPGVLTEIIRHLGLNPDPDVKKYFDIQAFERQSQGVQMLVIIYLKHTLDFWKQLPNLKWIQETAVNFSKVSSKHEGEINEWRKKTEQVFLGLPANLKRHALLIGLPPGTDEDHDFFDPYPPKPQTNPAPAQAEQGTFVGVIWGQVAEMVSSVQDSIYRTVYQNITTDSAGDDDVR